MEKVLILGASGLVGRALIDEFKEDFEVYGTYSSSLTSLSDDMQFQLEVQHVDKMRQIIRSIKPDVVISCLRGNFNHQLQFHKELAMELRNSSSRLYFFLPQMFLMGTGQNHILKEISRFPNLIMGNLK